MLVVQHDGYVINPQMWTDEFLKYDYIGAPWSTGVVGNGGFSLRSKRCMQEVMRLGPFSSGNLVNGYVNEDGVICVGLRDKMEKIGVRVAPTSLAAKFSFERNENFRIDNTFGFHGYDALKKIHKATGSFL